MATRVLQAGYYWPIVKADCDKYIRKCVKCQQHGNMIHLKLEELHGVTSPWPFARWGMDILGSFSPAKGQVKFLLVAIDYFTRVD